MKSTLSIIALALTMVLTACTVSDIPVSAVDEGQWAIDESYMDTSVNPGNDFFMYCNGGFWRNNPAVRYEIFGIVEEARTDATNRMRALTLPSFEKIKTDIDRIADTQSEAGKTIQGALDRISAVTTQEEAWKLMGQLMAEGFQTPVGLNLFSKDGKMALALYLDTSLEWYVKENSKAKADMNVDMPMRRQADVYMGLLDNPELVAAMQPVKADTRAVAPKEYQMYIKFCEGLGVSPDNLYDIADMPDIEVNDIDFTYSCEKLKELQNAPLDDLVKMMKDKVENDAFLASPDAFESLLGKGYGVNEKNSMINKITRNYLFYEQARHYADAYVTPEMKATVLARCEELRQTFIKRIGDNTWISDASKERMMDKLNDIGFSVGYPDQWLDWKELTTQPSFLDDIIALRSANVGLYKQLFGKDTHQFCFNVVLLYENIASPTNIYFPEFNEVVVLPANMMEPFSSPTYNQAANYATSYLFAHEIIHAFDSNCSLYDKYGNHREIFANEDDKKEYQNRTLQLVDCFNALEVMPNGELPGVCCDGNFTLSENIADLGGFMVAYDAYKNYLKNNGFQGEELVRQKRLFYRAYANLWRSSYSADFALYFTQGPHQDVHAMERERVNGIVMNTDDWYELFDIKPTDKLYVAPEKRVKIW